MMSQPTATRNQTLLPYETRVTLAPSSHRQLQAIFKGGKFLLPQDVDITEITLELSNSRATLLVWYYGRKPNGTKHQRRTSTLIHLKIGHEGVGWLNTLFPQNDEVTANTRRALRAIWPQGRTR